MNIRNRVIRYKEGYYLMIKGLILQEDIIILNLHTANNINSKEIKQNLSELTSKLERFTMIFGDYKYVSFSN